MTKYLTLNKIEHLIALVKENVHPTTPLDSITFDDKGAHLNVKGESLAAVSEGELRVDEARDRVTLDLTFVTISTSLNEYRARRAQFIERFGGEPAGGQVFEMLQGGNIPEA